jgi:ubiquinone/menaquinone biosynthesis C-methylase UbiE
MMSSKVDSERLYFSERQTVKLDRFDCKDWVLDIGGGGEGVIGQLLGQRVIAIDPLKRELEEAPETKSLKIVMDARELKFLDNVFNTATSFFTMMYISSEDKEKVFQEIYRVLKPGGELYLWDAKIPPCDNTQKDIYIVSLEIQFEQKQIETGYGTKWTSKGQNMNLYTELGENTGFHVLEKQEAGETFFIRFIK